MNNEKTKLPGGDELRRIARSDHAPIATPASGGEAQVEYVTKESALAAIDYMDLSNSGGRNLDAIAMLKDAR